MLVGGMMKKHPNYQKGKKSKIVLVAVKSKALGANGARGA